MKAWVAWFGTLGDSVVDMGKPFGAGTSPQGKTTPGSLQRIRLRFTDGRDCWHAVPGQSSTDFDL
jgi:hypothetical protein